MDMRIAPLALLQSASPQDVHYVTPNAGEMRRLRRADVIDASDFPELQDLLSACMPVPLNGALPPATESLMRDMEASLGRADLRAGAASACSCWWFRVPSAPFIGAGAKVLRVAVDGSDLRCGVVDPSPEDRAALAEEGSLARLWLCWMHLWISQRLLDDVCPEREVRPWNLVPDFLLPKRHLHAADGL